MFKHEKQLFHPVEIEKPNPQYAALLQEQLGGPMHRENCQRDSTSGPLQKVKRYWLSTVGMWNKRSGIAMKCWQR